MAVRDIYDAILALDEEGVVKAVKAELAAGTDVQVVLREGLIAAMDEIGKQFGDGNLFVPEMLVAADAMKAGLELLRPILAKAGVKPVATVVIGTVKGDLHDIGKNLVSMMLEGAGFRIVDLGTDVDPEKFISTAQENDAALIAMSSLLTTSMGAMESAVNAVAKARETRNFNAKVIVGGPPITPEFAKKIGADGYSHDAPTAVELARRLTAA